MNADNPIVILVQAGMRLEKEGDNVAAQDKYVEAWDKAADDQEKCIAAHFVARHQASPEETLKWNLEALERANRVHTDDVKGYYPSLYLNIGDSYETLGNQAEAARNFRLAYERIPDLPTDNANVNYSKSLKEAVLSKLANLNGGTR